MTPHKVIKYKNCKMSFKNEGTHSTFFDIFNNKKYYEKKGFLKINFCVVIATYSLTAFIRCIEFPIEDADC